MSFWQFVKTQCLLFFLFLFSALVTGGGQGPWANLTMNVLTFVTAGWLLTRYWRSAFDLLTLWAAVLATTLSFNGVTYLISYAAYLPVPDTAAILQDFALVTILTVFGILLGLRRSQTQSPQ
ncbi:MAG TPA: hypothetical protein GXX34_10460 [Clostridia bacterium]|nr:hypothetical protein [Clostridia bacterium]